MHYYTISLHSLCLSDHESEEKPEEKPQSRAGSGALAAPPAAALDPSDPSYRNYFNKIQAALSPPKSAAVSYKMCTLSRRLSADVKSTTTLRHI